MNPFSVLLILVITVPLLEIYLLIKIGGLIGVWPTILLIVLTAVVGTVLLRQQGIATLNRLQANLSRGELPAIELLEGVALLVGGALLLTPGFFTDAIGFACLLPYTRRFIVQSIVTRVAISWQASTNSSSNQQASRGRIIEGEIIDKEK